MFFENVYKFQELPFVILSDRDSIFSSKFWTVGICKIPIRIVLSSVHYLAIEAERAYKSETGKSERHRRETQKSELACLLKTFCDCIQLQSSLNNIRHAILSQFWTSFSYEPITRFTLSDSNRRQLRWGYEGLCSH